MWRSFALCLVIGFCGASAADLAPAKRLQTAAQAFDDDGLNPKNSEAIALAQTNP